MRPHEITKVQQIVNLCNLHKDFTFNLNDKDVKKFNYIVSVKNIVICKNLSLEYDLNILIKNILDDKIMQYDSIGLWFDKDTKLYNLDANYHVYGLKSALRMAELNSQKAIFDIQKNKVILL